MQQALPKSKMYRYCLADVAKGLFNGMIGNYLLYFYQPTVQSGLPNLLPQNKFLGFITVMALITGIGKVVDAVTDPLVATLSDKCTHKDGRRMPFLRYAALPYALSLLMIFYAPFSAGSVGNAIWVGFFLVAYYVSYTFFFIPRNALVPEIIPDANVRVGYYTVSTVFFMGSSAFMYGATMFVNLLKKAGLSPLWAWRSVFTVFVIIGIVCLLTSAYAFNENDYVKGSTKPNDSLIKSFGIVLRNRNFVIFSLGDLFSYISLCFFESAMLYYITMLLNIAESNVFYVLLAAIVTAICLFPVIVKVSKKYNKKIPLIIASALFTVVFTIIYVGDKVAAMFAGHELVIGIAVGILVAFPFAAINILPQSVISDIIQLDCLDSGVNREGIFSAVKTFLEKIAVSVAMIIVSSVLAIGAVNGEAVGMQGVKLTGVCAGVFSLLSLILFIIYDDKRVTEGIKKHNEANNSK